jgi:Transposase
MASSTTIEWTYLAWHLADNEMWRGWCVQDAFGLLDRPAEPVLELRLQQAPASSRHVLALALRHLASLTPSWWEQLPLLDSTPLPCGASRETAIGLDPFHAVAWATKALDQARREVWNDARRSGDHVHARQLKRTRWRSGRTPRT